MTATGNEPISDPKLHSQTEVARANETLPKKETNDKTDSIQRHSSRTWSRIWLYLFSFLLGLLLSFAFTIFLTERNGTTDIPQVDQPVR